MACCFFFKMRVNGHKQTNTLNTTWRNYLVVNTAVCIISYWDNSIHVSAFSLYLSGKAHNCKQHVNGGTTQFLQGKSWIGSFTNNTKVIDVYVTHHISETDPTVIVASTVMFKILTIFIHQYREAVFPYSLEQNVNVARQKLTVYLNLLLKEPIKQSWHISSQLENFLQDYTWQENCN